MRLILTAAILTACALTLPARADDPVSPACKLLTDAEAAQVLGHKADVGDGGAETDGSSACNWVDSENYHAIGLNIWSGKTFGSDTPDAAFQSQKESNASVSKVEDLPGVGEKAFLIDFSTAGSTSYLIYALKNAKMEIVTPAGLDKDQAILAAKLIAGHL